MAPRTTKKARLSQSTRAGIIFPVTRMHRHLKTAQTAAARITKGAAVYLASVVEYLVAEVLELSGNTARHNRRIRIMPRHILLAVASDEELDKFLHGCVIPQGGVLPSIHPFLVKKHGAGDSQDEPSLSIISSTRTKKTARFSSTAKTAVRKPDLTKSGLRSVTVNSAPKSKAVALKGTAVTTLFKRVPIHEQKLNVVQRNIINTKGVAIVHPTNNSLYISGEVVSPPLRASSIDIHPNAKWIQYGLTVAGGNGRGNAIDQLNNPFGLYVDDDQTVYVADYLNHRIVEWKSGATSGQVVAGGNGEGNGAHQLSYPYQVIVDKERDSLIICDLGNKRVVRWSRRNGTSGETIISNITCRGLTMDENGSLYVVDNEKDEVRRYRRGESEGTVVAGGNGGGNRLDQLYFARYVFVDRDHSVYVSQSGSHRVMKWVEGAKEGIVVAGGQGEGNGLKQLHYPSGVVVDQLDTVYVADQENDRIMRWPKEATQGSVIVSGVGQSSLLSGGPTGLSFDRHGNLYVTDYGNHRVQKFNIQTS